MMSGGAASRKLIASTPKRLRFRTYISFLRFEEQQIPHTTATAANLNLNRSNFSLALQSRGESSLYVGFSSSYDWNVRMRELGLQGNLLAARKLFDEMPERDKVSYASMVSIYLKHREFQRAEKLFERIPASMRSVVVDSAMVHAYADAGRMDKAKQLFDEMPERNAFSWTSLISGYFKNGQVDNALELFGRMPERERNEVTWTNVIVGLGRNGFVGEARAAFDRMPVKNVVSCTSMIKVYIEDGQIDEAFKVFHTMPNLNLYSWNIMIYGLLNDSRVFEAKNLFDSMPRRNVVSWTTMITGFAQNGMIEFSRRYFDEMPSRDISAWNAMITAYTDEGLMSEASALFKSMPSRNIVTWNAMLNGYAKEQQEDEVFRHFKLMLSSSGVRPNEISFTCLLTSCHGILEVSQAHGLVVHLGFEAETSLANTLITMYYRSGDVASAWIIFGNLESKDVVSWTAMILAYSNHGFGMQALQTFARMVRSGCIPDEITFIGVLSACSHTGLVKKGQMLFDSMRTYGLDHSPEHYSCLVDILGRAGLVNEALKVVRKMPPDKHDSVVLGTLIGACKLHGEDGLANLIGDKLIDLEPGSSGGYVMLANVFAASGNWEKFSDLRRKMKERDVKKTPGFSEIQVYGKRYAFLARDKSHPESKEIYSLLNEKLLPQMQDSVDIIKDLPIT
ncbi:pentatricopeptide repeat-containing protein At4g02750-like [Andrographis paniculata]|uniref:pentatricopeptide repeat-containing protein At4g02750-like n=1 Tax=Andrographis paniculata TaxID=175694 RepID=UPI0021E8AA9D|nr:pentatricopeptide repeat-containing protein At4g02750-like [Andrographis paniculata]XP_051132060.1 pentatricopeptide repeat-containing protein At4g02750-like [Andrographis paniculata]